MISQTYIRGVVPTLVAAVGLWGALPAAAQRSRVEIPADTVVRAELNQRLSSRDARRGDRVLATVRDNDRSGFPDGTRLEGSVTEVQRHNDDRPGIIDVDFRNALLPDGRQLGIRGSLASLADDDVRRTEDGRLVSRRSGGGSSFDAKWVGYGAGAGAILATVFGGGFLKGALLGGLGGAIYGYLNRDDDRKEYREVDLDRGTEFGMRLENRVAFDDRNNYRYSARNRPYNDGLPRDSRYGPDVRVLGDRREFQYEDTRVRVNNRPVTFRDGRPMRMNGTLYVPLAAVADAASLRYERRRDDDRFVLHTRGGVVRGSTGEDALRIAGARNETLSEPPVSVNGEVYVPLEFLTRVADLRADWNRQQRTLDLRTYR